MASRQAHRIEPKLGFTIVTFHMDMLWLILVAAVEEESVRTASEYSWHLSVLHLHLSREIRLIYMQ